MHSMLVWTLLSIFLNIDIHVILYSCVRVCVHGGLGHSAVIMNSNAMWGNAIFIVGT